MAVTIMTSPALNSPSTSKLSSSSRLHIIGGYEDGRVVLFRFNGTNLQATTPPTKAIEESENWELIWEEKGHREARSSSLDQFRP